jgi:hypothetical protein
VVSVAELVRSHNVPLLVAVGVHASVREKSIKYNDHIDTHTERPTMATDARRAHVVIPEALLREVDALVGPRRRSDFFVEAAREKIAREVLRGAAHDLAGSLRDQEIPGWETPEAASAWVRGLRSESDQAMRSGSSRE